MLEESSKLVYLLGKCIVSHEQSYYMFHKYRNMSLKTREQLSEWHQRQVNALQIDLLKERAVKKGFKALVSYPLGWIDEKHKYDRIKSTISQEITFRSIPNASSQLEQYNIYNDDVELIINKGKYYYVPKVLIDNAASEQLISDDM